MNVINRFDFDIFGNHIKIKYGEKTEENIKKEGAIIGEILEFINTSFSESLVKEIETSLGRNVEVNFEFLGRRGSIEPSEGNQPTLVGLLYTKVEGIWTEIAVSSDFKVILNAHLWYIKEKMIEENFFFESEENYLSTDKKSCSLCEHHDDIKCNSKYRFEKMNTRETIKGFHDCEFFSYDKTKSDLTKSMLNIKQMQECKARIVNKLNEITSWGLLENYVEKHFEKKDVKKR